MVKFLIERPIAVLVTLIAFLALGVIASLRMPVSLLPDIDIPEISVQINYPNTEMQQLEMAVVRPVRRQLLQLNHLKDIESDTHDGYSVIKLSFTQGTNIHYAYIEANEKIDALAGTLPRNMPRPKVIKTKASDIPVFYISIIPDSSYFHKNHDLIALSDYIENVVKKRIEQLSEVAMVDITGLEYSVVVIIPSKKKMESLKITDEEIVKLLRNNNVNFGSLSFRNGHYRYEVRFNNKLQNLVDIQNLFIKKNGRLFRLKDIATVKMQKEKQKGLFLYGNKQAISMAVFKQPEARMQQLYQNVLRTLTELNNSGSDVEYKIGRNQTALLSYSINNLKQTLLLGMLLAMAVMLFFFRDRKLPLLIALSIPSSLVISLFFLYLAGISINIISLSGLILGVGMMIDNSIIVLDNIIQYRQKDQALDTACIIGTNEVIRPLISSVLTTSAVFVPLVFLSGIAGALFYEQAISVIISLTVSLGFSIMVLPALYRLFYKNSKTLKPIIHTSKLEQVYEKGMWLVLRKKALFFLLFILLIPMGLLLFYFLHKQILPNITQTETIASINWNQPLSLNENKRRTLKLINNLDTRFGSSAEYVGKQQFVLLDNKQAVSDVSIYFHVGDPKNLQQLKNEIANKIKQLYPLSIVKFKPAENIFQLMFSETNKPLIAKIRPKNTLIPDIPHLQELLDSLSLISGDAKKMEIAVKPYYLLRLDAEKMLLYDIDYHQLINKLEILFGNFEIGKLLSGNKQRDIVLKTNEQDIQEVISNEKILNTKGFSIPFKSFISYSKQTRVDHLIADKQGVFYPLGLKADFSNYKNIIVKVEQAMEDKTSYDVGWSGSIFDSYKLFNEFIVILLISVMLLYFILAAQFESLIQPLIVLTEIIFDITGALFVLFLFDVSFNVMSAIGIVIMSGIVINDSILKIDTINQLRKSGLPLKDAVIEGGIRRFKPIVMTSITTILALMPLLFFKGLGVDLQFPLALSVIGALFVGTFVSLYFAPLVYYLFYRKKKDK